MSSRSRRAELTRVLLNRTVIWRQRTRMPQKSRDEFPERIKRTVAERAAYVCTNPACRRPTVGPHSEPDKSLKTGEACHICAAAPGGPRFDANQTAEQRTGIENAIWLCTECSTRIDKDETSYRPETLTEWKFNHETWIKNGGIVPSLPQVSLITIKGRTLSEVPSQVTVQDCDDFREHTLKITNSADAQLLMIDARVQVPEPIIESLGYDKPAGINVGWQPIRPQMVATIKGGGTVTRNRPPLPTMVYHLQIDRLPPSHGVAIGFTTSTKIHEEHDLSFDRGPFAGTDEPPYLRNYIDGTFQFEYRGAMLKKRFFVPIDFDKDARAFSIMEVREDFGRWQPLALTMFS